MTACGCQPGAHAQLVRDLIRSRGLTQLTEAEAEACYGCWHCGRAGKPYVYRGLPFSGLIADRGEKLCRDCQRRQADAEGINILVTDDRPGHAPYIYNTVRDADKVYIWLPPELRGVDGRDARRARRTGAR